MRILMVIAAALCAIATARADEVYPDLVGTWKGEGLAVARSLDGGPVTYTEDAITQIVAEQKGRRFAGRLRATRGNEPFSVPFVGVFLDETRFVWSEPGGFVEGRLVDADTIHSCYARTGETNLEAACNRLVRQK